jgi:hypothetical protein
MGNLRGWTETLDAIADSDHPDHDDAVEQFDEYDPNLIDELSIKYANRRNAAAAPRKDKTSANWPTICLHQHRYGRHFPFSASLETPPRWWSRRPFNAC